MSTGKAHARASKALAPLAAPGTGAFCHAVGLSPVQSALAALGAFAGCGIVGQILSPDLDQVTVTRSEWSVIKRLGPLGWIFVIYWSVYAWAIPHRHPISHAPILSTAIRLAYMFAPAWLLAGSVAVPGWATPVLAGMVVGLMVSDTAHWIMDFWGKE